MARANGFYWVRRRGNPEWEVACWCPGVPYSPWWLTGTDESFDDAEFEEIDERPIERPIGPR